MAAPRLQNFIDGSWRPSSASETYHVTNPATGEVIAEVPLGGAAEVDEAVRAAKAAFNEWRRVPAIERARYMFDYKRLLDENKEELAKILTSEHGKTLSEARGDVHRGIECVEVATGAPSLLMGQTLEDIARGIDCESVRQPVGVFACIAPFNFPAMVPLWFWPYALVCGNTFIVKPSEQVPLSQQRQFELLERVGLPKGVMNMVHGGKDSVTALCDHPDIDGLSFVGSSPVAKIVYERCAATGKRVQALGGAKNFMVVMPDADMETALDAVAASAYGCAGERCLAGSMVLAVGEAHEKVRAGLIERAKKMRIGDGAAEGTQLGPVISKSHKEKVESYIQKGADEGAELLVDGRNPSGVNAGGFFIGATLFDGVEPGMTIAEEEIFGPVLCVSKAASLEDALERMHAHPLANATSIFTTSGGSARKFKYESDASMTGINIGVAAPMSFFGFGGAKGSFFGDLKAHGREAFDFYTERKVVISKW